MTEIIDKRSSQEVKEYEPFKPLLDRILVRRIEEEKVEDGFVVPEKYRQHSNWGEVIAVGDGVVLGGEWHPFKLNDSPDDDWTQYTFFGPGDLVKYSEYCAEAYSVDEPLLWIVRIQDLRGVRRLKRG